MTWNPPGEQTPLDLMLLLSRTAQRDVGRTRQRPQNKRERRRPRSVKWNRLIGLFTACKLCLYKKRAGLNSPFSTKRNHTSPSPSLSLLLSLSLSLSLCPHERCVRAPTGLERIRRCAAEKKGKANVDFFSPPTLKTSLVPSCFVLIYIPPSPLSF